MADSIAFTTLCEELERQSSLDRLEARGTVRIVLKQAGLDARSVSAGELLVVATKLLPGELNARGVDAAVAAALPACLEALPAEAGASGDSPEAVFTRLGG